MSPQVSFYILQDETLEARAWFACRLADKAWRNGVRTHLHVTNPKDVTALDSMLWSYREDSFLPHVNLDKHSTDTDTIPEPVTLGSSHDLLTSREGLLINLGDDIPKNLDSFERIAEVVVQEPSSLELARTRFRQYKERGMPPKHQKVGQPS
ncbi:DNA polymerase III subunit chi [Sansalvadorimonas verongulae]|uniref:DNA polymerase III subunit chi n=1 Tax=Sansalvadorimonas verongulae TaxID=2172824 RepID=UPI0012BC5B9B|nr:DNA polymerase III subunit chi [Sansalvadorimonas verongulae]MTI13289.1 DNA polymerase III subunit chi [Sansalvadorimonas verongulae]